MSGTFIFAIICGILGFFIGGLYGLYGSVAATWHPSCWLGMLTGFIVGFGGCACFIFD